MSTVCQQKRSLSVEKEHAFKKKGPISVVVKARNVHTASVIGTKTVPWRERERERESEEEEFSRGVAKSYERKK